MNDDDSFDADDKLRPGAKPKTPDRSWRNRFDREAKETTQKAIAAAHRDYKDVRVTYYDDQGAVVIRVRRPR